MQPLEQHISEQMLARQADGRLRRLSNVMPGEGATIYVDARPLVNFASNDYMGLSNHPALKRRAVEYVERFGVGSTASRLICGNIEPYDYIERKLASLKGTEAALILPTGFQTNATVLAALSSKETFIACDRYSHNSILQGVQNAEGRWSRYEHGNFTDLDRKLTEAGSKYNQRWIATESVFSMDGDRTDIASLRKIGQAHDASIFLDEAHATGVLGEFGMGLSVGQSGITVAMGTFGKGMGSFGAYVACSQSLKDYLINFCAGLIYSTALPPAVLGAIDAALDVIPNLEKQRELLLDNADRLRSHLHKMGFETANSSTQIVPIVVGEDRAALSLAEHFKDAGIFAPAIRPPTVPDGTARVRLSLTVHHTREHLERVISLMRNWHAR